MTKLQTRDGRSTLRFERSLAHSPEKVWRALTQAEHINQWFPFDVEMEHRAGGRIRFIPKGGEGASMEDAIIEFEPPQLLAYHWGDDLLEWEIQREEKGCRLIFTHTFDDRAGAASFAAGWQVCLDAMEQVLAGETVNADDYIGPDWRRKMARLHERYVAELALQAGSIEQTESGWQVRFERQLTQPIDKVWTMLVAADTAPVLGGTPPAACTMESIPAGTITAVDAPHTLEYEWLSGEQVAGRVRWSLGAGTGHGARLVLTQSGSDELAEQQSTAVAAWEHHIEQLAKQVLESHATPQKVQQ